MMPMSRLSKSVRAEEPLSDNSKLGRLPNSHLCVDGRSPRTAAGAPFQSRGIGAGLALRE